MPQVMNDNFWVHSLGLLTAATGPLFAPKVALFTNNVVPAHNTAIGVSGLVEAVYTGYAQAIPTFMSIWMDTDGSFNLQSNLLEFPAPSDLSGQTIYGYWVEGTAVAGTILWADRFPAPVSLLLAPKSLVFTVSYVGRPGNNNGFATLISY